MKTYAIVVLLTSLNYFFETYDIKYFQDTFVKTLTAATAYWKLIF